MKGQFSRGDAIVLPLLLHRAALDDAHQHPHDNSADAEKPVGPSGGEVDERVPDQDVAGDDPQDAGGTAMLGLPADRPPDEMEVFLNLHSLSHGRLLLEFSIY